MNKFKIGDTIRNSKIGAVDTIVDVRDDIYVVSNGKAGILIEASDDWELVKETVSEDLNAYADEYAASTIQMMKIAGEDDDNSFEDYIKQACIDAANWQKLKDMGIREGKPAEITNKTLSSVNTLDAYALEVAYNMLPATLTQDYHLKNRSRIIDAVRLGAQWKEQQIMTLLSAEKENTGIGLCEYDAGNENGRMAVINSLTDKIKAL